MSSQKKNIIIQIVLFSVVLIFLFSVYSNVSSSLKAQRIATGFEFLNQEAGFEISESLIEYYPDDNYGKALWVGVLNTLKIAFFGNILAVILGTLIGISSLSSNFLLAKISKGYIEIIRNIPLLLQLFFWYAVFSDILPSVEDAINPLKNVYISNRGIFMPFFNLKEIWVKWLIVFLIGLAIVIFSYKKNKEHHKKTGEEKSLIFKILLFLIVFPIVSLFIGNSKIQFTYPEFMGFNFDGGVNLSPEFITLLVGLVLYTGAFIAEIVRSGIQSVDKGQWEAANSLGLSRGKTLRLIILPQALRLVIPPLTSQLLNLTKNSSLAVAIAYPDFVAIANTSMNQTGQAIELIALIMAMYLTFSLSTSLIMNWYNKKISLTER